MVVDETLVDTLNVGLSHQGQLGLILAISRHISLVKGISVQFDRYIPLPFSEVQNQCKI